jgi:hypothetical protein
VFVRDSHNGNLNARGDYFTTTSYKTTHEPRPHFGLGSTHRVDVSVVLPQGPVRWFANVEPNRAWTFDVSCAKRCRPVRTS